MLTNILLLLGLMLIKPVCSSTFHAVVLSLGNFSRTLFVSAITITASQTSLPHFNFQKILTTHYDLLHCFKITRRAIGILY